MLLKELSLVFNTNGTIIEVHKEFDDCGHRGKMRCSNKIQCLLLHVTWSYIRLIKVLRN